MQQSEIPPPAPIPPPPTAGWRRLHLASPILNSVTTAARFWPVLLIALFDEGGGLVVASLLGGALLVAVAVEVTRYLRFDYRLDGTTLVVRSGVLVRRTRTLPADRIQQVSLNQRLRHRLFNVAEVLIEVAGSGTEPDIKLSVVGAAEAERITVRLQDARRTVGATPPEPDRVVFEQPNDSLARWAAFASPAFMLPVMGAGVGALAEAVDLEEAWTWLPDGAQLWLIGAIGIVGLAAATAFNVARFYDMRLVRADDNFRLEYGLLTHRRLELPTERIQALVTRLSPAGRLAGTVRITAHNASSAGEATNSYLPAVPRSEHEALAARLLPEADLDLPLQRHPRGALRRAVLRWTRPVALVGAVTSVVFRTGWAYATFLLLPVAAALGWRAWTLLGHAVTADTVVARRGAITENLTVARRSRIQSVSLAANWFQRRLALATLRVEIAQPLGRVSIRDMAAADAARAAEDLIARNHTRVSQGHHPERAESDQ